jgi:hypothetical protein
MSKDVRREQIVLLKFEKELARLAALVAAMSATAASASEKIDAETAASAYEGIKQALVGLADATTAAHQQLETVAVGVGARVLEAIGGSPKDPPSEVVRSLLGLG